MFFQMHRSKFYLFLLILLLFQTDVFAYKYAPQRNAATSNHYTHSERDYQRLPSRNHTLYNQYSFSTFNNFCTQDVEGHTILSQYIKSLTWLLHDRSLYFERIYYSRTINRDSKGLINFNTTWEDSEEEKRKFLVHALWNASIEVVSETQFYQKYKYYVYEIESYLFVEYSKSTLDTNPDFYLPGESSAGKREEKKEYKVSLSAHVAPDEETAHIGTRVKFSTVFFDIKSNVVYLFRDQSTTFSTSNRLLNSYLGSEITFRVRDLLQEEKIYIIGLEYHF